MIESKRPNPELDTSVISKREQGEALNQVRNATYGIESKAEARIPTSEKVAIDSFWVNPLWPVNPFEIGTVKEKLPPKGSGRQVYDAEGKYDDRGFLARSEGQAPTGKKTVDTVYDNLGIVRDFYKKEFGRDGVDGRGKTYQATVNLAPFKERNYLFPGQVFWDGSRVCMVKTEANGIISNNTSVDIIGHEITHGVSAAEHSWNKTGQSGALNESFSDVFGSLIKQYSLKQTADNADWLLGVGYFKQGKALKNLLSPGTAYDIPQQGLKDPQPADMQHYVKTSGDSGGIHINSGIPNRAFALFAKAEGGYAWDKPGHIWFEAMKKSGSNPSFGQFAYQTIEAAKRLGDDSTVARLKSAWQAVGVVPSADAVDDMTPKFGSGNDEFRQRVLQSYKDQAAFGSH